MPLSTGSTTADTLGASTQSNTYAQAAELENQQPQGSARISGLVGRATIRPVAAVAAAAAVTAAGVFLWSRRGRRGSSDTSKTFMKRGQSGSASGDVQENSGRDATSENSGATRSMGASTDTSGVASLGGDTGAGAGLSTTRNSSAGLDTSSTSSASGAGSTGVL